MQEEETIKVLSLLKVAYPSFYKGINEQEAQVIIKLWNIQFSDAPADIVTIAINRIVTRSVFPPTISEVKSEIKDIGIEAGEMLRTHNLSLTDDLYEDCRLDDKTLARVKKIYQYLVNEISKNTLKQILSENKKLLE